MALRKFQLLSCDIALGGDILNVVAKSDFNPVTYPELILLRFIHGGDQWVTNVWDVGYIEREDAAERQRLSEMYGAEKVKEVFASAGSGQGLPNGDNRYTVRPRQVVAPPVPEPKAVLHNVGEPPVSEPAPKMPAAPEGPDAKATTPVIYGGEADDAGYVPSEHEMIIAGEAGVAQPAETPVAGTDVSPPRASRRPTPVAGN